MAVSIAGFSLGRAVGALLATQFYALGKAYPFLPNLLLNALAALAFNLCALTALYFLRRYIR
jgi:hypothetical protein